MRVSVVIPALNEQETVAGVVEKCLASNANEVLVIDPDSTDDTAKRAADAGAKVVPWREVDPREPWEGKGEALWRGVKAATGDVVVFVDADVTSLEPWWVDALAEPLRDDSVHLVKASYERARAGGRVTELTAKPLLRALFPQLAHIRQPLAGEYAIRRDTALRLPFVAGYGVEAGLLIDVASAHTPTSIAEAELSPREHRNRPLTQLGPMADVVSRTILGRAGVGGIQVRERPAWVDG
ncbi:glucosyl-3-phosphoglycerate synthase [Corynebacterium sp. HMSC05H05]|uniref:glucosyl-3-phosphoglycerate synthase n=1 Tax=Corynebacterium sp. HMSC05H05 TaxID=1581119 RepID=UPI0008A0FD0B|nr:glucosyl-3-phosphoglycerate synthase [Corynebacterium sp. HMSC05H05]OFT57202.1 glucosyl-3-phosphoglycerate synthase [Corynebacterium sp. HMSC05H05]